MGFISLHERPHAGSPLPLMISLTLLSQEHTAQYNKLDAAQQKSSATYKRELIIVMQGGCTLNISLRRPSVSHKMFIDGHLRSLFYNLCNPSCLS